MWKKLLLILILPLLLAGCRGTFTNISPTRQVRTGDNTYPVEVVFISRQKTLRWDSIEPLVLYDGNTYPMRLTPLMTNRWEGSISIPADRDEATYRFKFNYLYDTFGGPRADSEISPAYHLQILGE